MQVFTRPGRPALVVLDRRTEPLNITPHSFATPSRFLFSPKNPMPWVPSASTDVTKTWERARAAQKGGAL